MAALIRAIKYVLARLTGIVVMAIMRLRYRITLGGLTADMPRRGVLILANHPAEIDPVIISGALYRRMRPRAVVLESFITPVSWYFLYVSRALPIPDLEQERSREAVQRVRACIENVVSALQHGENVLIYPSGRLYRSGLEKIGGASGVAMVLKRAPDVPVMLVTIRGMWGSCFSCASGAKPDLAAALLTGMQALVRNFIFFCPRRDVSITCAMAPDDFPRNADKLTLNRWLEDWFNREGEEPLTVVPCTR